MLIGRARWVLMMIINTMGISIGLAADTSHRSQAPRGKSICTKTKKIMMIRRAKESEKRPSRALTAGISTPLMG